MAGRRSPGQDIGAGGSEKICPIKEPSGQGSALQRCLALVPTLVAPFPCQGSSAVAAKLGRSKKKQASGKSAIKWYPRLASTTLGNLWMAVANELLTAEETRVEAPDILWTCQSY